MSRVLVTGASGFVGSHLCDALSAQGATVIGTYHPNHPGTAKDVTWVPWVLTDHKALERILREHQPAHIYHLASPAHVPSAAKDPAATIEAIFTATVRFLDVVREVGGVDRFLYASSAEVYAAPKDDKPLAEDALIEPKSIYGICKSAASQWLLSQAPDLVTVVRPFNQIGPRQSPLFAIASFAEQLARIKRGEAEPVLRVGNLDVERDFSDIRDTARAHVLALEKGKPGQVYNIASGQPTRLRALLDAMIDATDMRVAVEVDQSRVRQQETSRIVGDATALRRATGWEPRYTAVDAARAALDSALAAPAC